MPLPLIDLAAGTRAQHAGGDRPCAARPRVLRASAATASTSARATRRFDAAHRFFALPDDIKARWHVDRHPTGLKRGFDPIGWQSLDVGQPHDLKESFYLGVEAHRPEPVARRSAGAGFSCRLPWLHACDGWRGAAPDGLVRAGARAARGLLRRLHAPPHLHHAAAALPAAAGRRGAGADRLRRAHRLGRADAAGAGRGRWAAGEHARRAGSTCCPTPRF